MSNLNPKQLTLLSSINKIRVQLVKQFKQTTHPDAKKILQQLLRLQFILMENKYCNNLNEIIKQNEENLVVLMKNMFVTNNHEKVKKKFKVSWSKQQAKQRQEFINKSNRQPIKQEEIPKNYKEDLFKKMLVKEQTPSNKHYESYNDKMKALPPASFVSAGILPKGTSVRKKFVPPFKKPSEQVKVIEQNTEEDEMAKNPQFKKLEDKLILDGGQEVKWNSIAGLGFAKKIIHEMIVWPMLRPDIFTGMRAPPRAILLFGPPGTGKTMIGKAIASQAQATFFSISASSLTSKWVGQSQKLVKTLFAIARIKQPSVIFIDEIDSLLTSRSEGEQESSRKVKTEFLIELDGAKTNNNERVLVIGATNLPHELDDAVRRRFVKRLYIPLPNLDGRKQLFQNLTQNSTFDLSEKDMIELASITSGYSGADLYTLCSQASMIPLRQVQSIKNIRQSEVPHSKKKDFLDALKLVKPSVNNKMLTSFEEFNQLYGSYQFQEDELQSKI